MGQLAFHHVGADLHVSMGMRSKATVGLDKIVIHHSQNTEVRVARVAVFRKGEVEARLEPVRIRPSRVLWLIALVAKPGRIRLRYSKL